MNRRLYRERKIKANRGLIGVEFFATKGEKYAEVNG